jgi:MtN3 and saliva related transmembrane protein
MQAHEVQALTGAAAATLPPISFVPEALKTIRTRDVSGISLGMYSLFATGVALWLVYGVMLGEAPIYVANAITLALALAVLVMKLRYR